MLMIAEQVIHELRSGLRFYAPYKHVGYMEIGDLYYLETDFHPWEAISEQKALSIIEEQLKTYQDKCYLSE